MKMVKGLGCALAVLGAWEIVSPWFLGVDVAAAQAVVVGALWVALGLWIARAPYRTTVAWLGWLAALLGLWLVIAPAALGYAAVPAALWNDLLAGFVGLVLGFWAASMASTLPAPQPPPAASHH